MEERIGAGVEVLEIARKIDDAEGVAMAPFDLNLSAVGKHGWFVSCVKALVTQRESTAECGGVHGIWFSGVRIR
jgi:hypothetical protein